MEIEYDLEEKKVGARPKVLGLAVVCVVLVALVSCTAVVIGMQMAEIERLRLQICPQNTMLDRTPTRTRVAVTGTPSTVSSTTQNTMLDRTRTRTRVAVTGTPSTVSSTTQEPCRNNCQFDQPFNRTSCECICESGFSGEFCEFPPRDWCPDSWTNDTANNRCIKIMDPLLEQVNASAACKSLGGSLVKLRKPQDQVIVNDMMWIHDREGKRREWGYFIDMNDRETTGVWKFEDGEYVTWLNWDDRQPNGFKYQDGQHCMALKLSSLRWHDTACTGTNLQYICMTDSGRI